MRAHPLALAALLAGMCVVSAGQGADPDEPLPKYPKAGALIPGPFHVVNINGDRKGRFHCLVCRNSIRPVAAIFVRLHDEADKDDNGLKQLDPKEPLAQLIKKLDVLLEKSDGSMGGFVVFFGTEKDDELPVSFRLLGDEAAKRPSLLPEDDAPKDAPPAKEEGGDKRPALIKELGLKRMVFGFDSKAEAHRYFKEGKDGKDDADDKPDPRAIPTDRFIKVLLYNNYRLVDDVWDFNKDKPLTEKDVDAIVGEFQKMMPPPFVNRKRQKTQQP